MAELKRLAERITTVPPNFKVHPLVEKVLADRAAMGRGEVRVDWGMGEHLAFASLVASGYAVRLSGEDSARGTFTHRHAVLHDQNRERWDEGTYTPLQHVADGQAPFVVIDSLLSEEAVLGFEYGYASAEPNTLVIWEAQFGDFVNGAQVVIDQFIASGEVKWGRANGLTLMLPHGYEGQGPEHSSARLERFMQLSADNNMQVVQPTSASQIFHVLRRQMVRMFRKPLIIMTPKSLLRAKDASSPLTDFTKGEFKTVIGEQSAEIERRQGQAPDRLLGQGLLRPRPLARRAQEHRRRDHPRRAALSVPAQGVRGRAEEVPEPDRGRVVPGRAAEPGRLVLRPALHPREHERRPAARLRRPAAVGVAGGGLCAPAPGAAEGAARAGLRQAQGLRPDEMCPTLTSTFAAPEGRGRSWSAGGRPSPRSNKGKQMALIEVKVPQLSESVAEATLLQWKKKPGQAVEMDEILVEIETDKVVLEVPAPAAGVLAQIIKNDGDSCIGEEVIAKIDTEGKEDDSGAMQIRSVPEAEPAPGEKPGVPPEVAALAETQERHRDAGRGQADGRARHAGRRRSRAPARDGRVTKGDVLEAISAQESSSAGEVPRADAAQRPHLQRAPPAPAPAPPRRRARCPRSRRRRRRRSAIVPSSACR